VSERAGTPGVGRVDQRFADAMDDDLATPAALAAVHAAVREGNSALDGGDHPTALAAAERVRAMTGALGLDPLDPQWAAGDAAQDAAAGALSALVDDLLEQRATARKTRDFATADEVRDRLTAAGVIVEDNPDGSTWTLKGV
jgi:cysteinyl-tRNA synthetase